MSLTQFLPGVVKELLKHVPTLVFDVTDWNSVRRDAPVMAARLFSNSGVSGLKSAQSQRLTSLVSFQETPSKQKVNHSQALGDAILKYYFAQLYCPEGLFLDLRVENCAWDGASLHYKTSGFWYRFTPGFRQGLVDLYDGFYLSDEESFTRGLLGTGLINPDWTPEETEKMKSLFRNHFAAAMDAPMAFNLVDFQKTFFKIFEFLIEKKVVLSSEFMLFGVYLVTLYLSLEACGQKHDVKKLYLEVREQLRSNH